MLRIHTYIDSLNPKGQVSSFKTVGMRPAQSLSANLSFLKLDGKFKSYSLTQIDTFQASEMDLASLRPKIVGLETSKSNVRPKFVGTNYSNNIEYKSDSLALILPDLLKYH